MPSGASSMRSFFEPKSIAVAGVSADPNKLGSIIYENLKVNQERGLLKASVYALNPAHEFIGGDRAYPSIPALPEVPELLIVAVPEGQTEALIESAAKAEVRAAIIVTSGYAETGNKDVEQRIAATATKAGMRIIGPNTIGVVDTHSGVDSLFLRPTKALADGRSVSSLLRPLKGGIVIVTQSGHLGQAIVEELAANEVGIRALVGTGNQVDVSVEDVIEYFEEDPETKAIAVYIEGVHDGRRFIDVSRRASRKKPVVVLKVGKTKSGARAALTHTASMVGDYDVYKAAFKKAGVVEAGSFTELVDFAASLSMLPPSGNRLAIVTNAGGVGAIAADEANRSRLEVEPLRPRAVERFRARFKDSNFISNASLGNPIDLTASVSTADFVEIVEGVARLPQYDLVLVLPTHQTPAIGPDVADRLVEVAKRTKKPMGVCVVGRAELASELQKTLMKNGVPSFPTPERAVRALAGSWYYGSARASDFAPVQSVRHRRAKWNAGPLSQYEISGLLGRYGLAEPKSVALRTSKDFALLSRVKYPVACKLLSVDLPHKTDVNGVVLGVKGPAEAQSCFARLKTIASRRKARFDGVLVQEMVEGGIELILGGKRDPVFGPVVVLGLGGRYVELSRDVSLAVAPVTPGEAKSIITGTNLEKVLRGYRRGPRASVKRLSETVSSFSKIMVENPSIREIEVNPLVARRSELLAVDSRASVSA